MQPSNFDIIRVMEAILPTGNADRVAFKSAKNAQKRKEELR